MARSLLNVPIDKFAIVHNVVKLLAIVCGLVLSQVCLMATIGQLTEGGWLRVLVGLAVNLLVPLALALALADRVLPNDPKNAKGLATDAPALIWLGFPFLFIVVAGSFTAALLGREASRNPQRAGAANQVRIGRRLHDG